MRFSHERFSNAVTHFTRGALLVYLVIAHISSWIDLDRYFVEHSVPMWLWMVSMMTVVFDCYSNIHHSLYWPIFCVLLHCNPAMFYYWWFTYMVMLCLDGIMSIVALPLFIWWHWTLYPRENDNETVVLYLVEHMNALLTFEARILLFCVICYKMLRYEDTRYGVCNAITYASCVIVKFYIPLIFVGVLLTWNSCLNPLHARNNKWECFKEYIFTSPFDMAVIYYMVPCIAPFVAYLGAFMLKWDVSAPVWMLCFGLRAFSGEPGKTFVDGIQYWYPNSVSPPFWNSVQTRITLLESPHPRGTRINHLV
jgi:hypothetical protein